MDRRQMLEIVVAVAVAVAGSAAVGCGSSATKTFDQPCGGDSECTSGLCVAGVHGAEPVCTKSCGNAEDCPEGWACAGMTANNVLVCTHGAATPFGH